MSALEERASPEAPVVDRVRRAFEKQGFMQRIGAEMLLAKDGVCRVGLAIGPSVGQQHGVVHGGAVASIADTAAGFAAASVIDPDREALTIEINFLAPAMGERLEAEGRVLKPVGSKVWAFDGEAATLVAIALVTMKATRAVREQ